MGKAELKIEVDEALLAHARERGLDIAGVVEDALRQALPPRGVAEDGAPDFAVEQALSDEEKARRWAEENAEAIKANRERIEEFGIFGEDLRTW
ncbi:MAG: type II toxin-antitoxin system CcdA family antitoxin [Phenylobacterium sp.]|nr:type II toxin-antitoxin system CcdA family antitoxin [Phenylobacterium sp.]